MIHLYLEEYEVGEYGEHFATTAKFISRQYLGSCVPMEMQMQKIENKFSHMTYFNDLRIFKFTWHINHPLTAKHT